MRATFLIFFTLVSLGIGHVSAQQPTPQDIERRLEPLYSMVRQEQQAVVETLRQLVNTESGSRDKAGLDQLAVLLAGRLRELGGKIDIYQPNASETVHLSDTPAEIGHAGTAAFQRGGGETAR